MEHLFAGLGSDSSLQTRVVTLCILGFYLKQEEQIISEEATEEIKQVEIQNELLHQDNLDGNNNF